MSTSVPLAQRALAPDLARGLALLGIVLANVVAWVAHDGAGILVKPLDASPVDRIVDVMTALVADNRGLPLFALLFGYGVHILGRNGRRTRWKLAQRMLVLAVIGLLHGVLLFTGDIIHIYALIGLVLIFAVPTRLGRIAALAAGTLMLTLWGWIDGTYNATSASPDLLTPSLGEALRLRGEDMGWGLANLPADLAVLAPMVLGWILARSRYLEGGVATSHLAADARRWLTVSLLGAVPLTVLLVLDPAGENTPELLRGLAGVVHQLTGLLGAVGAAALAGVVAARRDHLGRLRARIIDALAALGRMSLTGYVLQSVVAAVLFPASMLGLSEHMGTAGVAGIGVLTWLATMGIAVALGNRRGPLEVLLRRLSA